MSRILGLLFFIFVISARGLATFQDTEVAVYSTLNRLQAITLNPDYSVSNKIIQTTLIVDPKGREHGNISIYYDKLSKIESFEALLIDPASGKTIRKIKLKDLHDVSSISDNTIYQDARQKYYVLGSEKLPLKVEVTMEIRSKGNYYFPDWYPVPRYNQKVVKTSFELTYPEVLGIRYKTHHAFSEPIISSSGENKSLKWEKEDLKPQVKEKKVDDPYLEIAPVKFSMEGYSASMDSWEGLAKWMNLLNENKDDIPPAFKAEVQAMVEGVEDPLERIRILYQHLQKNYRYVSIQLGIGGWMSMPADEVVKAKYGDCKGLSMLMKAMLKEAGISAQYTLVRAGTDVDNIDVDFPSNQFNHVILRVPMENEENPLWLECTSNTLPAGYLGAFTKNRNVLVISDEGGFIDETPNYEGSSFNTIHSDFEVELKENGNAAISGKSTFFGNQAIDFAAVQYHLSEREKRSFLNQKLGGNGLLVQDYDLVLGHNREVATADVSFNGTVQRFSQNTSKRTIIPLLWKKIDEDMLANNFLFLKENYSISTGENLEIELLPPKSTVEDYYVLNIHVTENNGLISIQKELEIKIPEDLTKEAKSEAIKKINSQLNKTLILKKLN